MPATPAPDRSDRVAKTARLEARITAEQKSLLLAAAALAGCSLSDFVVDSAQAAAARTVREHEIMTLSARDRRRFVAALLDPPAPTARLRKAVRRHKHTVSRAHVRCPRGAGGRALQHGPPPRGPCSV